MNLKTIWRVPAVALIGGAIGWYVLVHLLSFTWVPQADGTMIADQGRQLLIYGLYTILFIGLTGLLFLRSMTKKEIFQSATVVVVLALLFELVSYAVGPMSGEMAAGLIYLVIPFEWMNFPHTLIHSITGEYTWFGSVLRAFMPYLYILFGKRN